MLLVGLLISTLAARVRAQADAARQREQRTQALYAMSRDLAAARTAERGGARPRRRHVVRRASAARSRCCVPERDGRARSRRAATSPAGDAREGAVAQWAFDHGQRGRARHRHPARRSAALRAARAGRRRCSASWACGPDPARCRCARTRCDLLEALARQAASGLERARLADEAQQAARRGRGRAAAQHAA